MTVSQTQAQALMDAAKAAYLNAYAPYSQFRVGAAVLTAPDAEGQQHVFAGCNVENAAYSLAICAERVALSHAIVNGYRDFSAIAVVAEQTQPCYPCGACRQFLQEFGPDMEVIILHPDESLSRCTTAELLPHAFSEADLLP